MDREDVINKEIDGRLVFTIADVANLVAIAVAAEREACAKVCMDRFMGDLNREDLEARRCAQAILARST